MFFSIINLKSFNYYPCFVDIASYKQCADYIHCLTNVRVFPLILDIDECEPVPCKNNATCIDGIDEFSCQCSPGYYGDNCTESKDHILIYHYVTIFL